MKRIEHCLWPTSKGRKWISTVPVLLASRWIVLEGDQKALNRGAGGAEWQNNFYLLIQSTLLWWTLWLWEKDIPVIPTAAAIPAKSYWRSTETNSHYYGRTAQKHNCIVLNLVFTDKEWHFGGSRICFIRFYHLVTDTRYYIRDSKSRVSAKK